MSKKRLLRLFIVMIVSLIAANLLVTAVFAQDDAEEEDTAAEEATPEDEAAAEEEEAPPTPEEQLAQLRLDVDTVWILVAGFLVFFMQAGFALLEAGFVRSKNVVNILMKNFFDVSIGAIIFWAIGWGIMYGPDGNNIIGSGEFFLDNFREIDGAVAGEASWFFQFAFAATAATIASGAMAGRTEYRGYLIYTVLATGLIYPIVGRWTWGGGLLAEQDFYDFAGSTIVHSTGAWIGLMGAVILGARRGRFGDGAIPMPGHNMTFAALGTLILWLGWFGFNPGSVLSADAQSIAHVAVTTNLAAAAGAIVAMALGWVLGGKPQLPWALNGALAGLVSITASADGVTTAEAVIIGAIGGVVMYFGVGLLESVKIDDPIGAVPVHGMAGVWGTLAVGIFYPEADIVAQVIGIVAVFLFVTIASGALFFIINAVGLLRVAEEGEIIGLDIYEHGMVAYPEFTNSPSEPTPSS
ncbi:MAG: ammonium transporter [Anaerolineales bacterium]